VGCSLPLLCCEQNGMKKINMEKQRHCGFDPTRLVYCIRGQLRRLVTNNKTGDVRTT
jgi:hypothetical protein